MDPSPSCSTKDEACNSSSLMSSQDSKQTILRLKRRVDDDPAQTLLLSFKRRKEEHVHTNHISSSVTTVLERNESNDQQLSILSFAGSIPVDNDKEAEGAVDKNIIAAITAVSGALRKHKSNVKRSRINNRLEKSKENFHSQIVENRFKVVSAKRKFNLTESNEIGNLENDNPDASEISHEMQKLYKLYDLVVDDEADQPPKKSSRKADVSREVGAITCNGVPLMKVPNQEKVESTGENSLEEECLNQNSDYVYDIYVSNDPHIGSAIRDQYVSVQRLEEAELVCEESEEEVVLDDEEDSNDESNWRNDYPDSDCDNVKYDYGDYNDNDSDDDFVNNFQKFNLNGDELSSDDDEERNPIYTMQDDGADGGLGFHSRYTAYKARVQQEMADEVVSSQSDSD